MSSKCTIAYQERKVIPQKGEFCSIKSMLIKLCIVVFLSQIDLKQADNAQVIIKQFM